MKSYEKIAQAMYAAYRQQIKTIVGINLSPWGCLPMTELQSWIAAAIAAHKEITEVH